MIFGIVISVCAGLSVIGGMFVIGMYLTFPELRAFSYRLIIYLAIFDLIISAVLVTPQSPESWCIAKGFLLAFGSSGRLILSYIIARCIYTSYYNNDYRVERKERVYTLAGIGVLAVMVALPFVTGSYGEAHNTCWISAEGEGYVIGVIWRILLYYAPWIVTTVVITIMYIRIFRDLKSKIDINTSESVSEYTEQIMERLKFYPIINVVVVLPTLVNTLYDLFHSGGPSFVLSIIVTLPWSLLGITHAVMFARTPSVKIIISRLICPEVDRDALI